MLMTALAVEGGAGQAETAGSYALARWAFVVSRCTHMQSCIATLQVIFDNCKSMQRRAVRELMPVKNITIAIGEP